MPLRPALAAALLMTTALSATAQQEPVVLDTIVLRNTEDASGPVGDELNPPTATGSKVPVALNEVPQSTTILGEDDIERFNAERVSEALRYTAGVTADVFGDDEDYDWLRIRGFQADQTGIYLDNAQNLSFAFGSFFIDPYALQRIEVLRGPSSALYGGSNPGGIVNYVSKRPDGRIRELTFGIDDAVGAEVGFDVGDDLGNGRAYRVVGRLHGGDRYDEFNDGFRGTLAPSFIVTTQGGTEITLLANIHAADEQHNGSTFLPYFGTESRAKGFGYIDPDDNFSDPDWDDYRRRQASVSAIVEHTFDNGFTFTGIGRLGVASVEESYYYPFGYTGFSPTPTDPQGTLELIAFRHDTLVRTAQTDLRLYGTVETGAISHDLLFGLDARFYELGETQASAFGIQSSAVGGGDPGTPTLGDPYRDGTTRQRQVGLYVQDQLRFGAGWIATFNLRHDWVSNEQGVASGFGAPFDRDDSETSWRTALAYEFANGFTPYASLSSSFESKIISPLDGVTEPETARQAEIGFKWAPEDRNFAVSAAAFRIDRENVVVGAFAPFDQLGEVRADGFEVEGEYRYDNGLTLVGAATFLDVETTEDSDPALVGLTPTLIPEREISMRADYDFGNGIDVGFGVRHRGESFADAANTLEVAPATLVDLRAGYAFGENTQAEVAITNVADERYVTGCQTAYVCSYGAGREVSVQVTRRW